MSAATASAFPQRKPREFGPSRHYTRMHHDFQDVLVRKVSGLVEYWSIQLVERKSIGEDRPKTEAMAYSEFARLAGVRTATVVEAIHHALKAKLIDREKVEGTRSYRYWTCRENWAEAPDYQVEPVKVKEPVQISEVTDNTEPAKEDRYGAPYTFRVKPGKAHTFEIAQTGQTIQATTEMEADVAIQPGDGEKELRLHIAAPKEPGQVVPIRKPPGKAKEPAVNGKPTDSGWVAAHDDDKSAEAVRTFLLPRFNRINATLEKPTVTRIWGAIAAGGGSIDDYKALVKQREKRGKMSAGAYVLLATRDLAAFLAQKSEAAAKGLKVDAAVEDVPLTRNDGQVEAFAALVHADKRRRNGQAD